MMTLVAVWIISSAASITSPESGFAGELIATWTLDDAERHLSISLDADGRCAVVAQRKADGAVHRLQCGYWTLGSRVFLRAKPLEGPRPVMELEYDRRTGELIVPGPGLVLTRQSMTDRTE